MNCEISTLLLIKSISDVYFQVYKFFTNFREEPQAFGNTDIHIWPCDIRLNIEWASFFTLLIEI